MPSMTPRSLARGRPPFLDGLDRGNNGSILAHCDSVNNGLLIGVTSMSTPSLITTPGWAQGYFNGVLKSLLLNWRFVVSDRIGEAIR